MAEEAWDYSHLPTDALCVIFERVFEPEGAAAALPLSLVVERWAALQLVCSHWREVLVSHPPPLYTAVSSLPEALLPWLQRLPLAALCVQQGLDARWSQQAAGGDGEAAGGPPPGMPGTLPALQLVAGMEGAGGPQPFWSLAPLTRLETLHLQAPVSSADAPAIFDSTALQGLGRLRALSLGSFADFQLGSLPASLRRLRLLYDGQSRTLSVPSLPPHASLERLRVEKPGALGVCLDDLWGQVEALELRSNELLLGVPVEDARLVRTFERPFREGRFVPPHIWGDEEADDRSKEAADMAANHLLALLPSAPRLARLRLEGGAAASAKFQPCAPHARASLRWLWSVLRLQGLHHQFGLSGQEMEARQRQLLLDDRLRFSHGTDPRHGEGWSVLEVLQPSDAAASASGVAPAGPEEGEGGEPL